MSLRPDRTLSAARQLHRLVLLVGSVALFGSCDSNGPRTGKLSLTVTGIPEGASAQITLSGPNNFSRVLTRSDVVASLKPGEYKISATSIRDGQTRYSPLADTQTVTIPKSNVPVEASVAYTLSSGVLSVTIDGIPTTAQAAVRVTGPNGFNQILTTTTTFPGADPGFYLVIAPEIVANDQRFSASPSSRQVQLSPGLTPTTVAVRYTQTTGTLTFEVNGLPAGATADISATGPAATYPVGASGNLVGVRAGQYTVNVKSVTIGGVLYIPNFTTQTVSLAAGATVVVTVNYTRSDGPLNLTLDGVTITQSVQTYNGTVPLVAGKNGFIRVFARANQPTTATAQVRVKFFVGGTLVNTMMLTNGTAIPLTPDQSQLSTSWNGIVLGQFIQPGLTILADVDPTNTVVEGNETDNTFPASGTPQLVDVRSVAPLRITFVPIVQRYDNNLTGNITEANKDQFLGDARRMLPLLDIDAQIHAPYTTADSLELTSNDGNSEWLRVLSEMNALRIAESSVRHYFGVVKVSYNSGIAGFGYVPGRAVVGWDYLPSGRNVAAHELTHNFGRGHAPCGGAGNPDLNYPYAGGTIGAYGYDLTTNTLRGPSSPDLMGYCSNPWISDYNYVGAMDWRASNPTPDVTTAGVTSARSGSVGPALLVWGRVEKGQLILEPTFSITTRPVIPTEAGPYRIEGLTRDGRRLFSYAFAGERPADAEDPTARHFAFAIPMDEATQGELTSIQLTGPGAAPATMHASLAPAGVSAAINTVDATATSGGTVRLQWSATGARMALIRDRQTGEILSFARGGTAQIRSSSADLEVILSDGVRSVRREIRVR
jgi:hypothetical protein